jgi:hypothetical protein
VPDRADRETLRAKLRNFGLLVGGILLFWGAVRLYRGRPYAVPGLSVGGALFLLGAAVPQALRLPYRGWMGLAHILGAINTRVLLFITFWLLIAPLGMLRRLVSGSALSSKPKELPGGGKSYWLARSPDERGAKHFENMF